MHKLNRPFSTQEPRKVQLGRAAAAPGSYDPTWDEWEPKDHEPNVSNVASDACRPTTPSKAEDDVTFEDVRTLGSPCKVLLRCWEASSPWECVVMGVVGNPVHVDIVLHSPGSQSAKFCFSSYMNHRFEMTMMNPAMVYDDRVTNISLNITSEEHDRCMDFLTKLVGNAKYSYLDALLLMPMAPKSKNRDSFLASFFDVLAEDQAGEDPRPEDIKKVFCSQSVVLMLRHGLDPEGRHSGLRNTLEQLNSRLVSPKQIQTILESYGATTVDNQTLGAWAQIPRA